MSAFDNGNPKIENYYSSSNIRRLLNEGFSEQELRRFCFDNPKFRDLYHDLSESTGKSEIIDKLLDYAKNRGLLEVLLEWAEEQNPNRYALYKPYKYQLSEIHDKLIERVSIQELLDLISSNPQLSDLHNTSFESDIKSRIVQKLFDDAKNNNEGYKLLDCLLDLAKKENSNMNEVHAPYKPKFKMQYLFIGIIIVVVISGIPIIDSLLSSSDEVGDIPSEKPCVQEKGYEENDSREQACSIEPNVVYTATINDREDIYKFHLAQPANVQLQVNNYNLNEPSIWLGLYNWLANWLLGEPTSSSWLGLYNASTREEPEFKVRDFHKLPGIMPPNGIDLPDGDYYIRIYTNPRVLNPEALYQLYFSYDIVQEVHQIKVWVNDDEITDTLTVETNAPFTITAEILDRLEGPIPHESVRCDWTIRIPGSDNALTESGCITTIPITSEIMTVYVEANHRYNESNVVQSFEIKWQ